MRAKLAEGLVDSIKDRVAHVLSLFPTDLTHNNLTLFVRLIEVIHLILFSGGHSHVLAALVI
jgi:hypothetical protein